MKSKPSTCKKCSGTYKLTYDNSAPIFTCDQCHDQDLTWQKFYNEYLQLFRTKDNWNNKKHQISCIIGFFCYSYNQHYHTSYVFVPKSPNPYSSKECRDAWALLSAFQGDAHKVRKYIYWLFNKITHTTNITSFGYLLTPNLIRKYNLVVAKKGTLSRESKLPNDFIDWCKSNASDIFSVYTLETMNDLGALASYVEFYKVSDEDRVEVKVIKTAERLGLIKNGKLNLG